MFIEEDDLATAIWNEILDAIPRNSERIVMARDSKLFTLAFNRLRALGYSKEDCNDFLNANLSELDPVT
jgi:hypothetical protein